MFRTLKTLLGATFAFCICVGFQLIAEWLLHVFYDWESILLFFGGHIVRAIISVKFGKFIIETLHDAIESDPNTPVGLGKIVYLPFGFLMYVVPIAGSIMDMLVNEF